MKAFIAVFMACALTSVYGAVDFSERIINGNLAAVNQFPWHVSIQGTLTNGQTTLCGGALIGPAHVLTAAHCVAGTNIQFFRVGFGSNNLQQPLVSMQAAVAQRVIHPNYNAQNFANDVALLRLPLNITYNQASLSTIRLPALSQAGNLFVNATGNLSGFGRVTDTSAISNELRFAPSRVIDAAQCISFYGNAVVTANVLCTLGQNFNAQGPCANDNGGPLVIAEPTGSTLLGIQSFISNSGCNAGHPAGFTRISAFITWISQNAGIPIRN